MSFDLSRELVSRLRRKKYLLEKGDPKHKIIKTALIVDGGAMKGAYAAGTVAALKELGMEQVFDIVIAVSSGTIAASYFLSGQADIAPLVFYVGLANKQFINIYKLNPSKIVGIDYGNKVFTKIKPLDQEAVKRSRAEYYVGVTDPDTGKEKYLDVKRGNIDIIAAMHASSAIPLLHNKPVIIHNKQYLDGMIGCGIPIAPALEQKCTDILIIENTPIGKPDMANPTVIKLFLLFFTFQSTVKVKKALIEKKKRYNQTLQEIGNAQKQGIHIGIIAPEKMKVGDFTINGRRLKQATEEARKKTLELFNA